MDPNAALRIIREYLEKQTQDERLSDDETAMLCAHVAALDSWLSNQGFLPEAWKACR